MNAEIIELKANKYGRYMLNCPKINARISENTCQKCEHCRIMMADYIKCNYHNDKNDERRGKTTAM